MNKTQAHDEVTDEKTVAARHDPKQTFSATLRAALLGATGIPQSLRRLRLSRAKHRSLAGHSKISKRLSRQIPRYEYEPHAIFALDAAPSSIVAKRQAGFERLATLYQARFAKSVALTDEAEPYISDLQFTGAYRVPFQFGPFVQRKLRAGSFVEASSGVQVRDLDGNTFYDLTGSYGVNVHGYDFYKDCVETGIRRVRDLGPVLGPYHPVVADNARRLAEVSGLPQVSFHMSGTEAVMQAVRLARYHTRRSHLVRFCGAYHGWWGDVQPGPGNPSDPQATYTLADMSEHTLSVLQTRDDIACVLVNPLQALHPNKPAPSDSTLVDSSRSAHFDRPAYRSWLQQLREVCSARGIVLIFDEVFVGFRLSAGGAQAYFGVQADMVTYGKTLGGGLPVGVLCGRAELMQRFREDRPADICFARGTFNSHPYVMATMNEFLQRLETPEMCERYANLDTVWDRRAAQLNQLIAAARLPITVAHLSTIWTLCFTQPSRYNWMLQYYLRWAGLALSWVGSGRLIFSLNYTEDDFGEVCTRLVKAASAMCEDGFFWHDGRVTDKDIKRQILQEMLRARLGQRAR